MTRFLFWNVMRRPLEARVARIAARLNVDMVMLAESESGSSALVSALVDATRVAYTVPISESRRIQIATRLPSTDLIDEFNSSLGGRLTIRRLRRPQGDALIAVWHCQSQRDWTPLEQLFEAQNTAADIARTEDRLGIERTLLVGDLNMNPFDVGVVASHALNAVMTRQLARTIRRTVAGRAYTFFYNPMWGILGDRSDGPPGTYFFSAGKPINYFWNTFDQLLLRPALMERLLDLRVLDSDGVEPLVTKSGRPRKSLASDHLPLYFELDV